MRGNTEKLDELLDLSGISPLKSHGLHAGTKIRKAQEKLSKSFEAQKEMASSALKVDIEQLTIEDTGEAFSEEIKAKAEEHDRLMYLVKEKLSDASLKSSEKIQILTLAPSNWSKEKTAAFFNVTDYQVKAARSLFKDRGILSKPDPKKGVSLPENVIQEVIDFYEDDEFSRLMPGKKDYVSLGKKIHKQKRLLLCNLNELYASFKQKYPHHKIGFSKFCTLRPKWCITVSSSGTHNVCVCTIHQNTILIIDAFSSVINSCIRAKNRSQPEEPEIPKFDLSYQDLMQKIVCDVKSLECMVHRCEKCPGYNALKSFIAKKFNDFEFSNDVTYTQWDSTDRTSLQTVTSSVDDFIDVLVYKVDSLTTHSFIAKSQAGYLRERKEAIDQKSCIILVDFAENYHYIVQDEVQGYHWNKEQCTVHPVVIYYKDGENNLQNKLLCFISDDLDHDTSFVHELQRQTSEYIKATLPTVETVEYFSDGCGKQYKGFKNFLNLCYHKQDFDLYATWSFFATSHGKSPCDGIGGTVKRKIARASLQRPVSEQIVTFESVHAFCSSNFDGIQFFTIRKAEMTSIRTLLEERYKLGSTVEGTRSFHHFQPLSTTKIQAKFLSVETEYAITHSFLQTEQDAHDELIASLSQNDYITCVYGNFWWVAMVLKVDCEEKDALCSFMHPHGYSENFHWPTRDQVYVPFSKILLKVATPTALSTSGRHFSLKKEELKLTVEKFSQLQ